jgi:hypothetical protein
MLRPAKKGSATARANSTLQRYARATKARMMPMMSIVVDLRAKIDGCASHHYQGAAMRIADPGALGIH